MAERDPAAEALAAERVRAALSATLTRFIASSVFLAIIVVAYLARPTSSRKAQIGVLAIYVAGSTIVMVLRNLLRVPFPSYLLVPFWDVPVLGLVGIVVLRAAPEEATWACGLATALCCMAMTGAGLTLRAPIMIMATLSAVVVLTTAHLVGGQPPLALAAALLVLLVTSALGWSLMRRTMALVRRVADEAGARVREVELLNVELRRQIADRAKQLSDAILRLSTDAKPLDAGSIIEDRYRVIQKLGAGGMGTVYEVSRIADEKRLALKVLSGVADREALARFAREAQIAAQLDHPNIVSVLDVDVSKSGMLFLVMELVAGSSLAAARANFGNTKWARPILRQIAAALAAMHSRGIVHRDLKPANVLLDGETVKVADFGIASLAPAIPDGDSTITQGLTRTGAFMGTPMYMAPELERGAKQATPASDVFALGIIAYELLSGKMPFSQPPVLAKTKAAKLDGEFGALVDRCLDFDPSARPCAPDLRDALAELHSPDGG